MFMTRKGSIVVEFKLKFKGKPKTEEALAPLKEGIKDGRMGSLRVDPESLSLSLRYKIQVWLERPSFFIHLFS